MGKKELIGLNTGHNYLNYLTCGWNKHQLIIVEVENENDAQLLSNSIAYNIAINGNGVGLIDCFPNQLNVSITEKMFNIKRVKSNGDDIIQLRNKIRKCVKHESSTAIIINCLNHILYIRGENNSYTYQIVRSLKLISIELNIPIILFTIIEHGKSLKFEKAEPLLIDVNKVDYIEDIADIILLYNNDSFEKTHDLVIVKNRMGQTGSIKINISDNHLELDNKVFDDQTNLCYFSGLLAESSYGMNILNKLLKHNINVKLINMSRDIWCRDYMPIQISSNEFVSYDYIPDYLYNQHDYTYITNPARIIHDMRIRTQPIGLILDGGNVVKTRKGIIMVDKVLRENDHLPKREVIHRLEKAFESEIILLPWERIEKYGHADGIVREIRPDKVLMTNYHQYNKEYAEKFLRILSKHFDVEILDFNVKKPCKHNWCYINFLRIGNKIFLPQLTWEDHSEPSLSAYQPIINKYHGKHKWYEFHIEEDDQAFGQFIRMFPTCEIIPVSCPHIVEQGGALNCISWNIKK